MLGWTSISMISELLTYFYLLSLAWEIIVYGDLYRVSFARQRKVAGFWKLLRLSSSNFKESFLIKMRVIESYIWSIRFIYLSNLFLGGVEKLDHPFHFDKEIYIDRFLYENKEVATQIKIKVKDLKKKVWFPLELLLIATDTKSF